MYLIKFMNKNYYSKYYNRVYWSIWKYESCLNISTQVATTIYGVFKLQTQR